MSGYSKVTLKAHQFSAYVKHNAALPNAKFEAKEAIDGLRYELMSVIYGEIYREQTVEHPRSWWQHLKHALYTSRATRWLFGGRWQRWFPVQMVGVTMSALVLYPRIKPPTYTGDLSEYVLHIRKSEPYLFSEDSCGPLPSEGPDTHVLGDQIPIQITPKEAATILDIIEDRVIYDPGLSNLKDRLYEGNRQYQVEVS
jgi:hypothetical protein